MLPDRMNIDAVDPPTPVSATQRGVRVMEAIARELDQFSNVMMSQGSSLKPKPPIDIVLSDPEGTD